MESNSYWSYGNHPKSVGYHLHVDEQAADRFMVDIYYMGNRKARRYHQTKEEIIERYSPYFDLSLQGALQ